VIKGMDYQKVLETECSVCKERAKGTYKELVNAGWRILTAFPKCRLCSENAVLKGEKENEE
jgi:hypothetical protein